MYLFGERYLCIMCFFAPNLLLLEIALSERADSTAHCVVYLFIYVQYVPLEMCFLLKMHETILLALDYSILF